MLTRRLALTLATTVPAILAAGRSGAATILAAPTVKVPLSFRVPAGATDCHVHVVMPDQVKYPLYEKRVYTPPPATPQQLLDFQHALHMDHVVIVTPSFYGTDNSATLAGMKFLGAQRARGIAVIGEATTAAELDAMARAGIRGVRMNLETTGITDPEASGRQIDAMVARIAGRPWHLQIYTRLSVIAPLKDKLASLPIPVVFDHFAGADAAKGPQQAGFDTVLDLVRSGKAYVKISGAYRASKAPGYVDVQPLAQALIAANPERLIWGSDWPHTNSDMVTGRKATDIAPPYDIDDGSVLNLLATWAPDAALRKHILVDNPRRLYGFR